MATIETGTKHVSRFVGRTALTNPNDAVFGGVVDTLDHDGGVTFYLHKEAFTSGSLAFTVQEADDASFTQNVGILDADHIAERATNAATAATPAATAGVTNALRLVVNNNRRFLRLRVNGTGVMTIIGTVVMKRNIAPTGTLVNNG